MAEQAGEGKEQVRSEAFDWMLALEEAPDDDSIRSGFESWLQKHPGNAAIYAEMRAVWDAAPRLASSRAQIWMAGRPALYVTGPRRGRISRRQWLAGAVAASAAAVFIARNIERADYETATGESRTIALADGSSVQLDTDSGIGVAIDADTRQITLLRGRAFLDVVPDRQRPMTVAAGKGAAQSMQTRFEICRLESGMSIAVEDGEVDAFYEQTRLPDMPVRAGQFLALDDSGAVTRQAQSTAGIASWRSMRLSVESWTVRQVVDELSRYHRGLVLLADETLAQQRVSGSYDLRRPVDALRAVASARGGSVREVSPWLLVISAG